MTEILASLLGAIIGGFMAIAGGAWERRGERRRKSHALRAALAAEIASLVEMTRRNDYEQDIRTLAGLLSDPNYQGAYSAFVITASRNYFTVYEANAGDIGTLPSGLAIEVIGFYQQARSILDSLSVDSKPDADVVSRHESAQHYAMLAATINRLCQFGDYLTARLAPDNITKHIIETAKALDASTLASRQLEWAKQEQEIARRETGANLPTIRGDFQETEPPY